MRAVPGAKGHPLDGMRVLDVSRRLPAVYTTKLLADADADVVKVERVGGEPLPRWNLSHSIFQVKAAEFSAIFARRRVR